MTTGRRVRWIGAEGAVTPALAVVLAAYRSIAEAGPQVTPAC